MGKNSQQRRHWVKDRFSVPSLYDSNPSVLRVIAIQMPGVIYRKFLIEQAITIEATGGKGGGQEVNPFLSDSTLALFLMNTALDALAEQRAEVRKKIEKDLAMGEENLKKVDERYMEDHQTTLPLVGISETGTPEEQS